MKKTKIPTHLGELDSNRQKRSNKPLPRQLELFDRAEYVPVKTKRRRNH